MAENKTIDMTTTDRLQKSSTRRVFSPRTDILENGDHYLIIADIPGADQDSISITLEKNVLVIDAKTTNQYPEGYTLVLSEYGMGDYTRRFVLTDQIDVEHIEANVKNGVLRLVLPKAGPAKAHTIKVNAG
jgi:HSP20 family molecular chaperone IbpA